MNITLEDGRKELFQWDTGRKLIVEDASIEQVHFSSSKYGCAIVVNVEDGIAAVPDILLQAADPLHVWTFIGGGQCGYTKSEIIFSVEPRSKPADYVYTPVNQDSIYDLRKDLGNISKLETQSKDSLVNAVNEIAQRTEDEVIEQTADRAVSSYFNGDITGELVIGEVADTRTGNFSAMSSSYARTDYISVSRGDKVYYSGRIHNYAGICGYDGRKQFIATILDNKDTAVTYTDYELSIPEGVKFIAASTLGVTSNPLKLMIVRNLAANIADESLSVDVMESESYVLPQIDNFAAFASFTAIGDSITAGLYPKSRDEDGTVHWSTEKAQKFSWPYYLSRLTGAQCLNYGISGATAKSWCENANGLKKMLAGKRTQAYIIGFGVNDLAKIGDDYPLGSLEDIHTEDSTENGNSFTGYYAKILQSIIEFNPTAKIFCLCNPRTGTRGDSVYEMAQAMCEMDFFKGHAYYVNMRKWERFYNAAAIEEHRTGVHYSAPGYCETARIMLPALSEVVNENPADFEIIPLIEYDELEDSNGEIILTSSTEGSSKKFRITVDDSGALSASEVTE